MCSCCFVISEWQRGAQMCERRGILVVAPRLSPVLRTKRGALQPRGTAGRPGCPGGLCAASRTWPWSGCCTPAQLGLLRPSWQTPHGHCLILCPSTFLVHFDHLHSRKHPYHWVFQMYWWILHSTTPYVFDLLSIRGYSLFLTPVVVQSLSRVRLLATPWTAACQASLSFTISQSLLKLTLIESVIPSNHLILRPLHLLPSIFPSVWFFSSQLALLILKGVYLSFLFLSRLILPEVYPGSNYYKDLSLWFIFNSTGALFCELLNSAFNSYFIFQISLMLFL